MTDDEWLYDLDGYDTEGYDQNGYDRSGKDPKGIADGPDGYAKRKEISKLPTYTKYADLKKLMKDETNCKPFTGEGISYRKESNTCILRSVDDTKFYDDDLTDINLVKYTLAGKSGDQQVNSGGNRSLLDPDLNHIYLYRVKEDGKKKTWVWYGEYTIVGRTTKQHIGDDSMMREIIKLSLERV